MPIQVFAVIKKESKVDPKNTKTKSFHASLRLLHEDETDYGITRYLSSYDAVAALLRREAGVTHEQLQDSFPRYQRGDDVRIRLTLENDEALRNLGFTPNLGD